MDNNNPELLSQLKSLFNNIDIIQQAGIVWKIPTDLDYDPILISSNNTLHDILIYQDDTFDLYWFKKQADFLESLSDRERFLLRTYSRNGDEIVNTMMRIKDKKILVNQLMSTVKHLKEPRGDGTTRVNIFDPVPLKTITTKNVVEIATKYANELFDIFKKAPPVETPLRVFRGIKPEFAEEPTIYPLAGVTSTSYNPTSARPFAQDYTTFKKTEPTTYEQLKKQREAQGKEMLKNCCIFDMILRPGVQAIWLAPISEFSNEQEIIILPTTVQVSYSHPTKKFLFENIQVTEFQTYDVTVIPIVGKTFSMKGGKTQRRSRKTKK